MVLRSPFHCSSGSTGWGTHCRLEMSEKVATVHCEHVESSASKNMMFVLIFLPPLVRLLLQPNQVRKGAGEVRRHQL